MCECSSGCRPLTTFTVVVEYCHDHQRWLGHTKSQSRTVEEETMRHGSASTEFGPFDGYMEVGYWLASQAKALRAIATPAMMDRLGGGSDDTPTTT